MTNFDYYKKQCLQDIVNNKESYEKKLHALKSITRQKKKDGSDFKNLIQNFWSAEKYLSIKYSRYDFLDELVIRYDGVEVNISYKDTNIEKYDKSRRIDRGPCLTKVVYLTIDEIFEKINELIEYYEKELEKTNNTIKEFEKITSDLEIKINDILEYIKWKDHAYKLKEFVKNAIYHSYDY